MKKKPAEKIFVPFDQRPKCEVPNCCNTAQLVSNSKVTGLPFWRKVDGKFICGTHHGERVADKHGLDNITQVIAKNAGFDSAAEYNNSRHRYRCNRLDYCQNCAGEAVWVDPDTGEHKPLHEVIGLCTYKIAEGNIGLAMLSVDHINGNNNDDRPENHQTLCHNCHKAKSILSKDHWSCEKKRKHRENFLKNSTSALVFG